MGLGLASFYYYFLNYTSSTGRLVAFGSEHLCIIAAVYPRWTGVATAVAHEMNELKRPSYLVLLCSCRLLSFVLVWLVLGRWKRLVFLLMVSIVVDRVCAL